MCIVVTYRIRIFCLMHVNDTYLKVTLNQTLCMKCEEGKYVGKGYDFEEVYNGCSTHQSMEMKMCKFMCVQQFECECK